MKVPAELTTEEMSRKLKGILESLERRIADREEGLRIRREVAHDDVGDLWAQGAAETLGAWKTARGLILHEFPFLEESKEPVADPENEAPP